MDETAKEEKEAMKVENAAQHAFEDTMTDLKKEEADLEKSLAELSKTLAEKKEELFNKEEELKKTKDEKKKLEECLDDIKPGCDFITENYEDRKKNRETEKGALENAVKLIKDTPAYAAAEHAIAQEALGDCKDICNDAGRE